MNTKVRFASRVEVPARAQNLDTRRRGRGDRERADVVATARRALRPPHARRADLVGGAHAVQCPQLWLLLWLGQGVLGRVGLHRHREIGRILPRREIGRQCTCLLRRQHDLCCRQCPAFAAALAAQSARTALAAALATEPPAATCATLAAATTKSTSTAAARAPPRRRPPARWNYARCLIRSRGGWVAPVCPAAC